MFMWLLKSGIKVYYQDSSSMTLSVLNSCLTMTKRYVVLYEKNYIAIILTDVAISHLSCNSR